MQVERVLTALPSTQASLASASQQADEVLSEVKKLEIRAMLTDQTIEEMEAQLYDAHNMSANTAQKAEDMTRKLQVRTKEMGRAQDRAEQASSKLEQVTNKLRAADIKVRSEISLFQHNNRCLFQMAGLQFNLEDRSRMDRKYKNQIGNLQAKISNADARFTRDEETLLKIKDKMHRIEEHRKKKEEEEKKKKKK